MLVPCFHQCHSSIVGCINQKKHTSMIRSFEEYALGKLRFLPLFTFSTPSLRAQTPFSTFILTPWWTEAEIVAYSRRLRLQLTQIRLKISPNSSYPLSILKESFAFFCSIKVFQVFLSVRQYCIHMCLVFHSKFKSPERNTTLVRSMLIRLDLGFTKLVASNLEIKLRFRLKQECSFV